MGWLGQRYAGQIFWGRLMKALQRLVVAGHWAVFLGTAFTWATVFYMLATDESRTLERLIDDFFKHWEGHVVLWGGLVIFAFVTTVSITLTNSRVYIDAANVTDSNDPIVVSNIAGAIASVLAP